jgi:hypothetical protein
LRKAVQVRSRLVVLNGVTGLTDPRPVVYFSYGQLVIFKS